MEGRRRSSRARCGAGRPGRSRTAAPPRRRTGCPRRAEDRLLDTGGQPVGQAVEHALGLVARERLEPDLRDVRVALVPRLRAARQLGPRRREQQQRTARLPRGDGQQFQQRVLGPVDVLDDDDRAGRPAVSSSRNAIQACVRRVFASHGCSSVSGGSPSSGRRSSRSPRRSAMDLGRVVRRRGRGTPGGCRRAADRCSSRPYDRHRPRQPAARRAATSSRSAATRLVLPTPASPTSVTKCGRDGASDPLVGDLQELELALAADERAAALRARRSRPVTGAGADEHVGAVAGAHLERPVERAARSGRRSGSRRRRPGVPAVPSIVHGGPGDR